MLFPALNHESKELAQEIQVKSLVEIFRVVILYKQGKLKD